jgi:hypothetical protein
LKLLKFEILVKLNSVLGDGELNSIILNKILHENICENIKYFDIQ